LLLITTASATAQHSTNELRTKQTSNNKHLSHSNRNSNLNSLTSSQHY
jgi:hypothetical protein